jgi:Bacterial protein of unknown function (Gcw_chp)
VENRRERRLTLLGDRSSCASSTLADKALRGAGTVKKIACTAALVLACVTAPSLADDSDKQTKTDGQAKADKQSKADREKAEKQAKEAREKAEKQAEEAKKKAEKKAEGPWDIAFGGALMSDYNFRGISLSDHRPAVSAYFEPRYYFSPSLQAYVNVTTNSITLPNHAPTVTEIYGGVRPTFDRLALDFGVWDHWIPGVRCFNFQTRGGMCFPQSTVPYVNSVPFELSYWEVYAKANYNVDRHLSFGGGVTWTPSVLNSGVEATYTAGWARYNLPSIFLPEGVGWFVSAEAGHWFRDATLLPSYTNWNAGLAFTWKQFTLDLRYSDTDRHDCVEAVTAPGHTSDRCDRSFVARLAFDLTKANLATDDSKKQTKTPWDIAFGAALMSDFNFRGISASDHRPAAMAYVEPRYDFSDSLQAYAHIEGDSISLPNRAAAALEMYAGVRPTFDRLALDFAIWEHWLTGGQCFNNQTPGGLCIPQLTVLYVNGIPANQSYTEALAKATYYVNKELSFGGRVAWTPSVLNSGGEATYVAGWAKYILPNTFLPKDIGWFISGEAGHWYRDTSPYPSYSNWNGGLAFTWKQFTLDLRYSNTDRRNCDESIASTGGHRSNRCGESFVAKLQFDLTKKNLK